MTDQEKLAVIRAHLDDGTEQITGTILDVRFNYRNGGHTIIIAPEDGGKPKRVWVPDARRRGLQRAIIERDAIKAELDRQKEALVKAELRVTAARTEYELATKEASQAEMEAERGGES